MTDKIFITEDNTATLICPACGNFKTVDVSKYLGYSISVKIKVRCKCGHTFPVFLERRQQFRKTTNIEGYYTCSDRRSAPSAAHISGKMTITDLSGTGIRMKLNAMPRFTVGDRLQVEFHLNDSHNSLVRKEVVVKNMKGYFVGAEYTSSLNFDSALGFYLRS